MRLPDPGRASADPGPRRRAFAVFAALVVFGGLVGVTQVSNAEAQQAAPTCRPTPPPASTGTPDGDAATPGGTTPSASAEECEEQDGREEATGTPTPQATASSAGLATLGDNCDKSELSPHTGFQEGNRCVSTAFGEVGAAEQNPTLLIAQAPQRVRAGEPFRIVVSTRNLVRDRFLPAGQGGYYRETSLLNDEGLVRGHFHTACRMLTNTREAAEPAPVPAFFVATEDGSGGDEPDSVIVQVPGLPEGLAQCSAWAGDGSHRIPMMQRANQIPALDSVRIQVQPAAEQPPADEPDGEEPPADNPGDNEPPADNPGNEEPPANQPGGNEPPANQPGGNQPPANQPGGNQPPANQPGGNQPPANQPEDDSPGQEPDQAEQPGNEQASGGQKPTPAKTGNGTARPAPAASEPTPDRSAANESTVAAGPPARDTAAGGSGGGLALTGANTMAVIGVGVALFIAGMALIYLTRRRRAVRR
ncbi:hypothetical protein [Plantactinospora soyae]|uniref:LPXTG-motif cell wall anchor domain-containing protein n=1 Tax=Plantactinospora soyae TaxID=1544732 RepID=A0A927R1H8_9ACTN|nr:hypothetical protein [Plantactinospora soyae]MBE1492750.1 hypothetical protein [Plantactinospora soyae]